MKKGGGANEPGGKGGGSSGTSASLRKMSLAPLASTDVYTFGGLYMRRGVRVTFRAAFPPVVGTFYELCACSVNYTHAPIWKPPEAWQTTESNVRRATRVRGRS